MWWSSKNCLVTVSTYGEGVVVLKELISNSFNFRGRVWWCGKNCFLTISTLGEGVVVLNLFLGGCGSHKRTDF